MASIEKRGAGRWLARYRDPQGRQRSKTFSRRIDAEQYLIKTEHAKQRGEWTDPAFGKKLYGEWIKDWKATTKNLRPSTRARDESVLRSLILPTFSDRSLSSIGQLDVRTWAASLSERELAPATIEKAYQILKKTLQAAVDASLIPRNPCYKVPLPRIERQEMRFLTPAQVHILADAIHPRYKALVFLGAYGGLRIGELAGLRPARVNLLKGEVEIAEILVEVKGHLNFGPPKTRAGRRRVGLPRAVVDELALHLEKWPSENLVFTAPEGGPLRVPAFRQRFWKPATRATGFEGLRAHDLRHTAVAMWIAADANPKEVAARAGHASVSLTFDRYGHLFPEADIALRDRLNDMFVASQGEKQAGEVLPLRSKS